MRRRQPGQSLDIDIVQALDRGLLLLGALAREGKTTLTELGIGMPPSSTHGQLITLQKHCYADFDEATQEWMVGVEATREAMHRLLEETAETANLTIAAGVVVMSQVETQHPIRAFYSPGPGTRGPMRASGIGKMLLADMARRDVERILQKKGLPEFTPKTVTSPKALFKYLKLTRARDWTFDDEGRHLGMRCIAAPVYNGFGEAVAGISVSGPVVRLDDAAVAPKLRRAGRRLLG